MAWLRWLRDGRPAWCAAALAAYALALFSKESGVCLVGLALLGWLSTQAPFFEGLGVTPNLQAPNDALALLAAANAGRASRFQSDVSGPAWLR